MSGSGREERRKKFFFRVNERGNSIALARAFSMPTSSFFDFSKPEPMDANFNAAPAILNDYSPRKREKSLALGFIAALSAVSPTPRSQNQG